MDRDSPIVVVGAGIGGLTAGLAFAAAGFSVEILERAERLEEAGAGLQLSPNPLRVLRRLGVDADALSGVAAETVTLRAGASGRPIAEVPVRSRDGTAYLSLHRADLQAALAAAVARQPAVTLRLGAECLGIARQPDGYSVTFRQAGVETERRAVILVAADGVRSRIAAALGEAPARPTGHVAWRMMLERPPGANAAGIQAWLGPARHAVAYPVRSGRQVNLVLIGPESDGGGDLAGSADKRRLAARFAGWDSALLAMIDAAGPATPWPLASTPPARRLADPAGVILIGDAAHAMPPYAAQGAAMAIEDAAVAAWAVAGAAGPAEAAERYTAARAPRLSRLRRRVAFHRLVYHLPFPLAAARNMVLRLRSPDALAADLGWLYDWVPPSS